MGFGAYISFRDPLNPGIFYDTLENDFFDVFFQYGTIGLMLYLFICIRSLYITYNSKVKGLTLLLLIVVVYSMTAGHTLFNATGGLLFAYISILGKHINLSHSFNAKFS
jgi:O-antigen ligase